MKRKISFVLMLAIILVASLQVSLFASEASLYNNNTLRTCTSFVISSDGIASVNVEYNGYSNVTTGATISITIEKRNLWLFWSDAVSDTISVSGDFYSNEFVYQLEKSGTYRCTVEYVISGTGGADDVITYEETQKY